MEIKRNINASDFKSQNGMQVLPMSLKFLGIAPMFGPILSFESDYDSYPRTVIDQNEKTNYTKLNSVANSAEDML